MKYLASIFSGSFDNLDNITGYPILNTRISVRPSVTLRLPPLDSERGWTGGLWSNTNLLK